MSRTEWREYVAGIVAAGAILIVLTMAAMANRRSAQGNPKLFHVSASFGRADGINVDSPVRIAGMDVGRVSHMALGNNYQADLILEFRHPISLPEDTSAAIQTEGLFGSKFVEIEPGGEDKMIPSGGRISYAQDSVILEDLIDQIIARAKGRRETGGKAEPAQ
jgi:phospholipid/cholesterol/gamma-HCH transport system substrate-binding protein